MNLEKEAQRRSIFNQMARNLNPVEFLRYRMSDKYRDVSDRIEAVDSEMREAALSSDPGIRESLHQARMALKNREYPRTIYHAWKVLEVVDGLMSRVDKLESLREKVMEDFYGEGTKLQDSELKALHQALGNKPEDQLKEKVEMPKESQLRHLLYTTAAPDMDLIPAGMVKQAGVGQWLQENLPSWRSMEGALLDKIFRNKMGKQREAARKAVRMAEKIHKDIKKVFQQLDAARSDFSSYLNIASKAKQKFEQQKQELSALYQEHFSDIVPDMSKHNEGAEGVEEPKGSEKVEDKKEEGVAPTVEDPELQQAGRSPTAIDRDTPPPPPPPQTTAPHTVDIPGGPPDMTAWEQGQQPVDSAPPSADAAMEPVSQPDQMSFDFEQAPPTQRSPYAREAAQVVKLWKKAQSESKKGNKGISATLLVKASEICDSIGDEENAKSLILAAEQVLQG